MHFRQWKRREFITLLGGAAAWPLAARAQQPTPIVGLVSGRAADASPRDVAAFRKGLNEPATSKARTLRSNTVGQTGDMIVYRTWRPISLSVG